MTYGETFWSVTLDELCM